MLERFFNRQSKTITAAAVILGAASLLSRLLGILRDRVLAGQFGAGAELDMYYAAFRLPDLLYNLLILGALSAGFIPVFSRYLSHKSKAWQLVNDLLNVMFFALIFVCGVLFLLAPWLVKIITPGFFSQNLEVTVQLTRIMLLSPIFLGLSGLFGNILQSFKKFFIYSLSPILYNVGIILGALFLTPSLGIYGLAWGVVLGAFAHMLVQIFPVFYLGYRYHWVFNLNHPGFLKILKMMAPRTLGLVVSQLNFLVVTIIGSTLAAGSIAIFNLANNIQSFPLGLFGVSFAIAAFPTLSELADKKKKFIETLSLASRQILFLVVPSSALLIVLRAQIVRVILGSGRFDWEDTVITLQALSLFAFSLFAQSLVLILARAFYAQEDSKTPFYVGLASAAANIIIALVLVERFGVLGLALAFSLSNILNLTLLFLVLHHRLGQLDGEKIAISAGKILIATFMLGLVAQAVKYPMVRIMGLETFLGVSLQMVSATLAGLAAYLLTTWLLRSEELILLVDSIKKKVLHKPEIPEEIVEQEAIQEVN